jgi:hypothetical protein
MDPTSFRLAIAVIIIMSVVAPKASADQLEDYTTANRVTRGCTLIPDQSIREHCQDEQVNVNKICKESSCKGMDKDKDDQLIKSTEQYGEYCVAARKKVQEYFTDARNKIGGENDARVREIGQEIVTKMKAEVETHENSVRHFNDEWEYCKKLQGR